MDDPKQLRKVTKMDDPHFIKVFKLFIKFKDAFKSHNFDTAGEIFKDLKVLLTGFKSLPPLFEKTPNYVREQLLARDIYEHAVLMSTMIEDTDAFDRDFPLLKPLYDDARVSLPWSSRKEGILGRYLVRLLEQNRIDDFHTELKRISAIIPADPYINNAVMLEELLSGKRTMHCQLQIREEISERRKRANDSNSVSDALEEEPHWEIHNGRGVLVSRAAPGKEKPPA